MAGNRRSPRGGNEHTRRRRGRAQRPLWRKSQNLDHLAKVAVNNLQQGEYARTGLPRCSAEGDSDDDNAL